MNQFKKYEDNWENCKQKFFEKLKKIKRENEKKIQKPIKKKLNEEKIEKIRKRQKSEKI